MVTQLVVELTQLEVPQEVVRVSQLLWSVLAFAGSSGNPVGPSGASAGRSPF
ncbi:hypothetical protein F511_25577 [Dorcoceras hygrometricum]|uniref:Uncharacterized protein n=1 Tax=Dorcoceras hygrometricum TaxID=472368 RepID=A0A2Z7CB25_9LAMI|nr:hypothetical protein F511_25577 [Dorcoceras hygrometricum]